jgi:amino acid permease
MLLVIVIILLLIWAPGYHFYGRRRYGWGCGGHVLTLILVIIVLWLLVGGRY